MNTALRDAAERFDAMDLLEHIDRAEERLGRADLAGAKEEIQAALTVAPNDPRALAVLSRVLAVLEQEPAAAPFEPLEELAEEERRPPPPLIETFRADEEILRIRVGRGGAAYLRSDALLAAEGSISLTPAQKRFRGVTVPSPFIINGAWMARAEGEGSVLASLRNRTLVVLHLSGDDGYVSEDHLVAFPGSLDWENGRLLVPGQSDSALHLLRLHGQGRVVVSASGRLHQAPIFEGGSLAVEASTLVAWTGRLTPKLKVLSPLPGQVRPGRFFLELTGEGSAYLEVHR